MTLLEAFLVFCAIPSILLHLAQFSKLLYTRISSGNWPKTRETLLVENEAVATIAAATNKIDQQDLLLENTRLKAQLDASRRAHEELKVRVASEQDMLTSLVERIN